jgi:hypothetical protein
MSTIEFDQIWKDIDQMETIGIPQYCQDQLFWVNCIPFSFRNFRARPRPDELVICMKLEPRLINSSDVVPRLSMLRR